MSSSNASPKQPVVVAKWSELVDRQPVHALVADVDLVLVRYDDQITALYGRCLHRGALLADGRVEGPNLICGLHDWDYRLDSGVSAYSNDEALPKFGAWVDREADTVRVDQAEIAAWAEKHPQPYDRDAYLGAYDDVHGVAAEPFNRRIRALARDGLGKTGHHGPSSAMGVPLTELPRWDSLQLLTAQLARKPLLDDAPVATELVIGPAAV